MPRLKVKRCGLAEHCRRVCLVAPRHPESFWSLQGTVDLMGAKTLVPNSALATLIALTPSDAGVEFVLGDENVSAVDLDLPCDLVAITRSLLTELVKWNRAQTRPLSFSTQITVQVADDEELLRLFADALFRVLFVGVETPRRECLEEVHKVRNLDRPLEERLRAISRFGIVPFLGLIVGFDGDDLSVFDEMYSFIDETASPVAGISMLNAPRHTPLYQRLSREGRLAGDDFSGEWQLETNIAPKQMTREELARGYWELFARVYDPERFDERLQRWLSTGSTTARGATRPGRWTCRRCG